MPTESEIVAQKMKNHTYYSEAMGWFHSRYTKPNTQLSLMFITACLAIFALFVSLSGLLSLMPINPKIPMAIYRPILPYDFITIQKIAKNINETKDAAIIKYMTKEYVKARHEYIDTRLPRNINFVNLMSNPEVAAEFLDEVSLENPNNPKLIFGNKAQIYVEIDRATVLDSAGNPVTKDSKSHSRALVRYSTFVVFDDGTQQQANFEADISFQYREIIVDQETNEVTQTPELVVTSYKTKSI